MSTPLPPGQSVVVSEFAELPPEAIDKLRPGCGSLSQLFHQAVRLTSE